MVAESKVASRSTVTQHNTCNSNPDRSGVEAKWFLDPDPQSVSDPDPRSRAERPIKNINNFSQRKNVSVNLTTKAPRAIWAQYVECSVHY